MDAKHHDGFSSSQRKTANVTQAHDGWDKGTARAESVGSIYICLRLLKKKAIDSTVPGRFTSMAFGPGFPGIPCYSGGGSAIIGKAGKKNLSSCRERRNYTVQGTETSLLTVPQQQLTNPRMVC